MASLPKSGKPLVALISAGNVAELNKQFARDPDLVNAVLEERKGARPLHLAVERCTGVKVIELLVRLGADLDALLRGGTFSALAMATELKDKDLALEVVRSLVSAGASPCVGRNPAVQTCVRWGNTKILRELLSACSSEVAKDHASLLFDAVYACKRSAQDNAPSSLEIAKMVRLLVSAGFDPDVTDFKENTPLHIATACGCVPVVKELVKAGADVNAVNKTGDSPIKICTQKNYAEIMLELFKAGCVIEEAKGEKVSLLSLASNFGAVDTTRLLLAAGACINWRFGTIESALCMAAFCGRLPVVDLLLQRGAFPDPLACSLVIDSDETETSMAIFKALVRNGVQVDSKVHENEMPLLMLACEKDRANIVAFLLNNGANLYAKNFDGKNVFHLNIDPKSETFKLLMKARYNDTLFQDVRCVANFDDRTERCTVVQEDPDDWGSWQVVLDSNQSTLTVPWDSIFHVCNKCERGDFKMSADDDDDDDNDDCVEFHCCRDCRLAWWCSDQCWLADAKKHASHCAVHQARLEQLACSRGQQLLSLCANEKFDDAAVNEIFRLVRMGDDDVVNFSSTADGSTPLLVLCQGPNQAQAVNMVSNLLWMGALATKADAAGTTPLLVACRRKWSFLARILLECKVDVNAVNSGESPLIAAAAAGSVDIVRLLLAWEADVDYTTPDGQTALSVAKAFPSPHISRAMTEALDLAASKLLVSGSVCMLLANKDQIKGRCKVTGKAGDDGKLSVKFLAPAPGATSAAPIKVLPSDLVRVCSDPDCVSASCGTREGEEGEAVVAHVPLTSCRLCRVAAYCSPDCLANHASAHEKECRLYSEVARKIDEGLVAAVILSDAAAVKAKLAQGARVNLQSAARADEEIGRSPLHLAESEEVVRLLLEGGADVNALDGKFIRPAVRAIARPKVASGIMRALLADGAFLTYGGNDDIFTDSGDKSYLASCAHEENRGLLPLIEAAVKSEQLCEKRKYRVDSKPLSPPELGEELVQEWLFVRMDTETCMALVKPVIPGADPTYAKFAPSELAVCCSSPSCSALVARAGSIKCPQCLSVLYCSKNCRLKSSALHGFTCKIVKTPLVYGLRDATWDVKFCHACQEGIETKVEQMLREKVKLGDINSISVKGMGPLSIATHHNHAKIVTMLAQAGADVNNSSKKDDHFPLLVASQLGYTQCVKALIEAKANVNMQASEGTTLCMLASAQGYPDIISLLVAAGADVNKGTESESKGTALIFAIQKKRVMAVQVLTELGAVVDERTIQVCIQFGDADILRLLFAAGGPSSDIALMMAERERKEAMLGLCYSVKSTEELCKGREFVWFRAPGEKQLCRVLSGPTGKSDGVEIELLFPESRHLEGKHPNPFATPNELFLPCSMAPGCAKLCPVRGSLKCPGCLCVVYCSAKCRAAHAGQHKKECKVTSASAEAFATRMLAKTAWDDKFTRACEETREDLVIQMLSDKSKAGNVNEITVCVNDGELWPIFMFVCYKGHEGVIKALIEAGADVNFSSAPSGFPLLFACQKGHLAIVKLLCDAGADVNKTNSQGVFSLFLACQIGHLAVVKLLCDAGADVNKTNSQGVFSLYVACRFGHLAVVKLLCDAGADVDKVTPRGTSALLLCAENKEAGIGPARLLLAAGADWEIVDKENKMDVQAVARHFGNYAFVTLIETAKQNGSIKAGQELVLDGLTTAKFLNGRSCRALSDIAMAQPTEDRVPVEPVHAMAGESGSVKAPLSRLFLRCLGPNCTVLCPIRGLGCIVKCPACLSSTAVYCSAKCRNAHADDHRAVCPSPSPSPPSPLAPGTATATGTRNGNGTATGNGTGPAAR